MTDNHLIGTITMGEEIYGHLQNATLQGLSAYEVAVANGFTGTEAEWLASLKGETGATPDISIGNVTTGRPGTNVEVSVSGTPENPVMDFTIPRGDVGATPNMTIGTVTTGEEGTQAQATITGTPEDPVLNLTIPKGDTGDAGFDPVVEVTKDGNTATVSVTDATHTTEVNIVDGYTPQKNVDYFDGHSPKITGAKSQGTTFIYSDGEQIGAIADGQDGYTPRKGVDYFDGHTPAISGEKIDDTTFIYADGVRIATVLDGLDGNSPVITTVKSGKTTSILADSVVIGTISDGADGHSPTITTTKSGKTTTILSDGTSIGTVSDGQDGHSPEITTNKVGKVLTILSDGQTIGTVSDGADAVAPTITTNKSGNITTIYSNGESIGTVVDGTNGISSIVTVSKSGTTTTVYVDGVASASIEDGADGSTPVITATKSEGITTIKANGVDIATINDGTTGNDGYSPTASVTKSGNTATITITDKSGTTTAQVSDGAKGDVGPAPEITSERSGTDTTIYSDGTVIAVIHDGQDGDPGQDGVSPSATVTQTSSGATITIADKTGTTTATVTNGQDGDDGYSPSASVSKSGRIATITVTDKTGTTTAQVSDGQDGTPAIIDVTPTEDSPNAVSSGGVYDELSDLKDSLSDLSDEVDTKYEKPANGIPASDLASGVVPDVSTKADKVINATSGNFASLDSNGNIIDSGHKHSDYLTQHQDISGKADKVQNATSGNFASLDSNGNLTDSGKKPSDYLTEHQDLSDYVKNTDYANSNKYGLIKPSTAFTFSESTGALIVNPPSSLIVKNGIATAYALSPSVQHESAFYGLAKAAGDTTQSSSSNAVGTYTEDAKIKIQKMLGIYEAPWELIREDTFTNETEAAHIITVDGNGNSFELSDLIMWFETPIQETYSAKGTYGQINYYFNNGTHIDCESGEWTQNANAASHGVVHKIEQDGNMLYTVYSSNTKSSNSVNLYVRYLSGFTINTGVYLLGTKIYINEIRIPAVTGTGHYKLYGKRKWS